MIRCLARCLSLLLLALAVLGISRPARAHVVDTATMTIVEKAPGRFLSRFAATSPTLNELPEPAVFPSSCRKRGAELDCGARGLVGAIEFPWLEGGSTRLLVTVEWLDGTRLSRVVDPSSPHLNVYGVPSGAGMGALLPLAADYVGLGVEHIWMGFDHLLFVVALTLLVRRAKLLLATVTAFTVAHSITLAATTLGVVSLPSAPVEATIALSIVLVCAECLRPEGSFTRRAPWAVAFTFGLLHGFGFASALLDIGLPEKHVPMALFCFNVGVELGQLVVVAVVIGLRELVSRTKLERSWLRPSIVYAMGGLAAFWTIDRVRAVFGH
jgi:hydrogenase/urease accessory protein HupE